MTLDERRRAIRHLLNERVPADAAATYYAFYHPDEKTQIFTAPEGKVNAQGYICLARTGIDLFRPLVTLRLPYSAESDVIDPDFGFNLIEMAIPEGMAIIMYAPEPYRPLLSAFFDTQQEQTVKLMVLERTKFEPIINVLITQSESPGGLPRFEIHRSQRGQSAERDEIVASAGLNWQSDLFAEIYVHTKTPFRRLGHGQSVVAYLVQHIMDSGRTPLYVVSAENTPSIQLAESVGFVDTGIREVLIEGIRKSHS